MMMHSDNNENLLIHQLANRFCPEYDSLKVLSATRKPVVEIRRGAQSFVLKSTRDSIAAIGQVGWIDYLRNNGIGVPSLISSTSGQLVEEVVIGEATLAGYCYERVTVEPILSEIWQNSGFIKELGCTIGRMHTLAEAYESSVAEVFPSWDSPLWIKNPGEYFASSSPSVIPMIIKLREKVSKLSKDSKSFGLIHDDLHAGNVFSVNGKVVILDFECLHVNWFVAEIASTLLFHIWIGPEKEKPEVKKKAIDFLTDLLAGYVKEHVLTDEWYEYMPLFLKLREISLFATYFENTNKKGRPNDKLFGYVSQSIINNKPVLEIDFRRVSRYVR